MNHLDVITIPLDQALVHHGRYVAVGMDPISAKQSQVGSVSIDDEEGHIGRLLAKGQLYVEDSSDLQWAPFEVVQHVVSLDEVISRSTNLAAQRVGHDIDRRSGVDKHPADRLAIDEALYV